METLKPPGSTTTTQIWDQYQKSLTHKIGLAQNRNDSYKEELGGCIQIMIISRC